MGVPHVIYPAIMNTKIKLLNKQRNAENNDERVVCVAVTLN